MDSPPTLKERIHQHATLRIPLCNLDSDDDQLARAAAGADLLFLDGQHGCFAEERIPAFCQRAARLGVPVIYRMRHPRLAWMAGYILDHGPLGIIIPQIESPEQIRDAVEAFYYPPLGRRGWGPTHAYGRKPEQDRRIYADWWNATGILAVQLESREAISHAREWLAPFTGDGGVDLVLFGPRDLSFSLEAEPDPEWPDLESCYAAVRRALADLPLKVSIGGNPFGEV